MDSPSDRLAAAMQQRRLELDLTWKDLATAAKISVATLGAIRRGVNEPSALNKRRLENALRWEPGGIDAIYAGDEPTPLDETEQAPEPTLAELVAQLAEERQARLDLERRFDELLAQQEEEKQRRGKTG